MFLFHVLVVPHVCICFLESKRNRGFVDLSPTRLHPQSPPVRRTKAPNIIAEKNPQDHRDEVAWETGAQSMSPFDGPVKRVTSMRALANCGRYESF